jgi:hypothetical protein
MHIQKLMFTCGFSEPSDTNDGKRGIIFHAHEEPAQRSSRNRPAGTIILIPDTVDCNEFYQGQVKIGGIIDQIIETGSPDEEVLVQMDNASPHTGHHMIQNLEENCVLLNKKIKYITQPPNSPDLNVNDLCFFNSLSKRADRIKREGHGNISGLKDSVKQAYDEFPRDTIVIGYGHLWSCFNEILVIEGGNKYKSPHDQVRERVAAGIELRTCSINCHEYDRLKKIVDTFFERDHFDISPI